MDFEECPHRRYNPLTDEWVLVSPHRSRRPWQGQSEELVPMGRPEHDATCYLCAGNRRANGTINPDYSGPYVFENDFPALLKDIPAEDDLSSPLFKAHSVRGTSRVICFSERHDLTLPALSIEAVRKIVDTWVEQYEELARDYGWVAIFENKGSMMGCSNPHPHGQIWASDFIPSEVQREDRSQKAFLAETGSNLLVSYAKEESARKSRVFVENEDWIAVVPFWAVWPFETLLMPRGHRARLSDLGQSERFTLADILKRLCESYDKLFKVEFPYSMGWHGAPPRCEDTEHWQLHAHFYPPLLRSATVRKFLVGYEMLAEPQRDLTAEQAAARLRAQSETERRC